MVISLPEIHVTAFGLFSMGWEPNMQMLTVHKPTNSSYQLYTR